MNPTETEQLLSTVYRMMEKSEKPYTIQDHEHFLRDLLHRHNYGNNVYHMERWAFTLIFLLIQHLRSIETFVRYHMEQKRDDRCWGDDARLYELVLDEKGWQPQLMPKGEFLENCSHYWDCQAKGLPYQGKDSSATTEIKPKHVHNQWCEDPRTGFLICDFEAEEPITNEIAQALNDIDLGYEESKSATTENPTVESTVHHSETPQAHAEMEQCDDGKADGEKQPGDE